MNIPRLALQAILHVNHILILFIYSSLHSVPTVSVLSPFIHTYYQLLSNSSECKNSRQFCFLYTHTLPLHEQCNLTFSFMIKIITVKNKRHYNSVKCLEWSTPSTPLGSRTPRAALPLRPSEHAWLLLLLLLWAEVAAYTG